MDTSATINQSLLALEQHNIVFSQSQKEMLCSALVALPEQEQRARLETTEIVVKEEGLNATSVAAIILKDVAPDQVEQIGRAHV